MTFAYIFCCWRMWEECNSSYNVPEKKVEVHSLNRSGINVPLGYLKHTIHSWLKSIFLVELSLPSLSEENKAFIITVLSILIINFLSQAQRGSKFNKDGKPDNMVIFGSLKRGAMKGSFCLLVFVHLLVYSCFLSHAICK